MPPQPHKIIALIFLLIFFLTNSTALLSGYIKPLPTNAANIAQQLNETTDEKASVLTFFGAFPTNGSLFYRLELVRPALDYALDLVRNTTFPGDSFEFQYIGTDVNEMDACDAVDNLIVYKTIDHVTQLRVLSTVLEGPPILPVGYFGPGCYFGVRDMAKWLNVVNHILFDAFASSTELSNKTAFRTLIRTGYTDERLLEFYQNILNYFGWSNVTIFYQRDDPVWRAIYNSVSSLTVQHEAFCDLNARGSYNLRRLLEDIAYNSTAILVFGNMECVQELLIEAVNLNLTVGNQMTFVINRFFKARYWGSLPLDGDDQIDIIAANLTEDYKENLRQAYNRSLVVSYYYNSTIRNGMAALNEVLIDYVSQKYPNYTHYEEVIKKEGINPVVLSYYYGVFMYAKAVQSLINASGANYRISKEDRFRLYDDGKLIAEEIRRIRSFDIPHIGTITLNENGDFPGQFSLKVYDQERHTFRTWAAFETFNQEMQIIHHQYDFDAAESPLRRPSMPGPTEDQEDYATAVSQVTILIGAAAVVVFVIACSGLVIRYYVNKTLLANRWWDIKPQELTPCQNEEMPRIEHDESTTNLDAVTLATIGTFRSVFSSVHHNDVHSAYYKNRHVATRIVRKKLSIHNEELLELRDVRVHHHDNLLRLYGVVIEPGQYTIVQEYSARGTLADFLVKDSSTQSSDWAFRYSLLHDLFEAVIYIHKLFGYHGRLSSLNCMIDRTFVLKVRDYAPKFLQTPFEELDQWDLFWTAPEILRHKKVNKLDLQRADIYSIGIILQEIAMEGPPYPNTENSDFILPASQIINWVRNGVDPLFRPVVPPEATCPSRYRAMMESCWSENPIARPTVLELKARLRHIRGNVKGTLIDDLFQRVQSHADQLQKTVDERTLQLREEQSKIQGLLYELLPPSVADRLITTRKVDPEPFECVTIYFSDIVSFTTIAAESTPDQVVHMLNLLYQLFDSVIENYDAYKVETIGDAYMVVSGLPNRNGNKHATICSLLALNILHVSREFRIPHRQYEMLEIRIGIHSGPCVAGVVGTKMPRYCLFGDTVNTASRMESTSEANRIQLSPATYELIKSKNMFTVMSRGEINVKGKGAMETYWLTGGPLDQPFPKRSNTISSSYFVNTMRGTLRRSRKAEAGKRLSLASISDL
ncbi:atrial natriuretic peptide receptor 2-like [Paramacrobiotus metropolitanus]|uniref:atrial natriuretic peptide receptor 2-like n=1 Tax=Paramacrobiotus metropolitanus TaxID=2943436 RepID=UPI002445E1DD|nr:atrial natriuretic peptide receptor 2-like [Paramacrobiotus metropolitanus]